MSLEKAPDSTTDGPVGDYLWMHFTNLAKDETTPPFVVDRAEGSYIFDTSGRKYLDASAGLACVNIGHGRREVADAATSQYRKVEYWPNWTGQTTRPVIDLAKRIAGLAPGDLNRVFFTGSGSESVEAAWKMARQYHLLRGNHGKYKVVARNNSYHGTTLGALAVTGIQGLRSDFAPLLPTTVHAPAVKAFGSGRSPQEHSIFCASEIRRLILEEGPETVAAVFLEPVQNSGGSIVSEPIYFEMVREICDEYDVLLISDETIAAWGRIGEVFGSQAMGYVPDIITTAKGLTSAYFPMGAVIAADRIAEPFRSANAGFAHGYTFGGHPVAAAAAHANLDILLGEDLCGKSRVNGADLRRKLEGLSDTGLLGEVRGMALFQTVELAPRGEEGTAFTAEQTAYLSTEIPAGLRARGVIFRAMHLGQPLLQMSPPLSISTPEIDELVGAIRDVLTDVAPKVNAL